MAGNSRFDHDLVLAHKFPERSIALGVGACGRNAIDSDELKYVYHENGQQFVQVLPTFAALFSLGSLTKWLTLINKVSLAGLHDKGKAAILELETKSYEKQSGELLISTIYLLGAGGFSNSSHPYSYSNYPEKQAAAPKIPKSQPFAALLNRLSGDYNPLHSDPMIAEVLGSFSSRPILHGIVLPGILQLGQSSNASAEGCKHHQDHIRRVPFACLYPGETLITEMVIYQAKVKERNRAVLSGFVELRCDPIHCKLHLNIRLKRSEQVTPDKERRHGKCPSNSKRSWPYVESTGFMEVDVHIYVASGEVYDGERYIGNL
ncbi:enoyl-CoA hydratase 2 [Populus alba x Populus x berolinensis]|uniref:Enoyl-CoA hydratase 2 n=1 Tax=Populus alba x Populus x berolinensis TaxID=444605 RepID=A0AAD6W4J3_9ROSI|nr:enoyl-CoA hydratase 2 [Populus alba x Populus x berolinensis]